MEGWAVGSVRWLKQGEGMEEISFSPRAPKGGSGRSNSQSLLLQSSGGSLAFTVPIGQEMRVTVEEEGGRGMMSS